MLQSKTVRSPVPGKAITRGIVLGIALSGILTLAFGPSASFADSSQKPLAGPTKPVPSNTNRASAGPTAGADHNALAKAQGNTVSVDDNSEGKKLITNLTKGKKVKKKFNPETCSIPKTDKELRKILTPEQYEITKKNGTERPFQNRCWDNKHHGIYVDIISKEPLFSSKDKFDSGTGWPSFHKPIQKNVVTEKVDTSYGMKRVEIRSQRADSHLGHVFDDGPGPDGLRFCINSGSLLFIPLEEMENEGYEDYIKLFSPEDLKAAQAKPFKK